MAVRCDQQAVNSNPGRSALCAIGIRNIPVNAYRVNRARCRPAPTVRSMNPPTRSPSIKGRLRPQWCIIAAITAGYLAVAGTGIAQKPDSPPRGKPAKPPASTADAPAKTKAMKLMIPQIQFSESPLDQVLASIAAKVKELDPDEKGFLIKGPA